MSEMVRWQQTLNRDLLTEAERKEYFFEFLPDALLRGDLKSRYEAYAIARNWGFLSANEIRDRENLNHIDNGDIYLQPLNMVEAGTKPPPVSATGPAAPNSCSRSRRYSSPKRTPRNEQSPSCSTRSTTSAPPFEPMASDKDCGDPRVVRYRGQGRRGR
jgi:hypothetical protein